MTFVEQPSTWPRNLGFMTGYLFFTTALYFLLVLVHKVSLALSSYLKVMLITLTITILTLIIKQLLK